MKCVRLESLTHRVRRVLDLVFATACHRLPHIVIDNPFTFRKIIAMLKHWMLVAAMIGVLLSMNLSSQAGEKKKSEPAKKVEAVFGKDDELNAKDSRDTHRALKKSPCKTYAVKLTKDIVYQIDLKSKDFDAIARIEDPKSNQVAFNDDALDGKGTDARLLLRPGADGEFTVVATNRDGKAGKFSVAVVERPDLKSASIYPEKSIALKWQAGKVKHAGSFMEQDGLVFSKHYKAFTLNLEKGKAYRIELQSGDFDAFLVLEDPNGNIIAQDDDSSGGVNARITFTPEAAGLYRIIATTATARCVGGFEILVSGP